MLAGYSFGACVAYEAAQALMAAGRDVTLLGILDGPFGRAVVGMRITMRHWPKEIKHALALWGFSWDAGRRAMLRLVRRFGVSAEIVAKRSVYLAFRKLAVNRWSPAPIGVETLLAVSDEMGPRTLSIWQRMCTSLRVVQLPGDHVDIFHAPASDRLLPVFEDAVRAAHARTRTASRIDDPSSTAKRSWAML
jgi:thioesterase domain-containing protein